MLPNVEEKLDPRVKRTRKFLQDAFVELLGEKGFKAVTVQNIAERAEVNRATFYAHYPDKYALLAQVVKQSFQQEVEKRMLNTCHFSMENLQSLIIVVCEFVMQTNGHCTPSQPLFESQVESEIKNYLQLLLRHWIEGYDTSINSKTASVAASWAIYGLALMWSREKKHEAVEEFANKVLPLVSSNLGVTDSKK